MVMTDYTLSTELSSAQDELMRKFEDAEAVSFDFFDTLFGRLLIEPEDLFDVLDRHLGISGFRQMRIAAQKEAFRRMLLAGKKEITFEDIYGCFTGLPADPAKVMRKEYDLELALLYPNRDMTVLFEKAISAGKSVVLTSDMYLPVPFFLDALQRYGLPVVPMFISSDRNATKRDHGELFDIVAGELGINHGGILHIGDNVKSDIQQAQLKGITTFHYKGVNHMPKPSSGFSPETSLSRGMLRKFTEQLEKDSASELGFLYGGPAAVAFLDWIIDKACQDNIEHILFVARDGYNLNRLARLRDDSQLPGFCYFLGSRTVFTLASITEDNFLDYIPFFLSGAEGLSPFELLERIGVQCPDESVMSGLGLGPGNILGEKPQALVKQFLYAYRWEILRVCQKNRQALFLYLKQLGITSGSRIALVDIGWNGSTQIAFEKAVEDMMNIEVFGYYFCFSSSRECQKNRTRHNMSALYSEENISAELLDRIYRSRIGIELIFSAPHPTIIGLNLSPTGQIEPVYEVSLRNNSTTEAFAHDVSEGIAYFASSFDELRSDIGMPTSPVDLAMPLIEFITQDDWHRKEVLHSLVNFDGWSRTRNRERNVVDYLESF